MLYRSEHYINGRMMLVTSFIADNDRIAVKRAIETCADNYEIDGWRLFQMPDYKEVLPQDGDW